MSGGDVITYALTALRENTREAFVSTHVDGQATGYGEAVVHVPVDAADAQLDDEFPDGEQHYRIPLDRAEVIEAFTVAADGTRVPLAGTVTVRAASFPAAPQARDVTVSQARPTQPAAGPRGPELGR